MNPNQDQQTPLAAEPASQPSSLSNNEFPEIPHTPEPPETQTTPYMGVTPTKKSHKKAIIGVLVAVLLVLGSATAAFGLWYNKPENVVADSFMKVLTAKSSEGTVSAKVTEKGSPTVTAGGDFKQSEASEVLGNAKVTIDNNGKVNTIDGSFAVSKDQTFYVKINQLKKAVDALTEAEPMVGVYTQIFDDVIKSVDGKWVSISQSDIKELTGEDQTDKEMVCVEQKYNEFLKDNKQQQELRALYEKHPFIKVKSVGMETVDGVYSNRYELTGDEKVANDFANGVKSLTVFKNIDGCLEQDLAKDINDELKDSVKTDNGEKTKVEYWVGVVSHEPVKFNVVSTKDGSTMNLELKPKLNTKPSVEMPKADKTLKDLSKDIEAATNKFYETFDPGTLETDTTSSF
jgi:hypothetical protein